MVDDQYRVAGASSSSRYSKTRRLRFHSYPDVPKSEQEHLAQFLYEERLPGAHAAWRSIRPIRFRSFSTRA